MSVKRSSPVSIVKPPADKRIAPIVLPPSHFQRSGLSSAFFFFASLHLIASSGYHRDHPSPACVGCGVDGTRPSSIDKLETSLKLIPPIKCPLNNHEPHLNSECFGWVNVKSLFQSLWSVCGRLMLTHRALQQQLTASRAFRPYSSSGASLTIQHHGRSHSRSCFEGKQAFPDLVGPFASNLSALPAPSSESCLVPNLPSSPPANDPFLSSRFDKSLNSPILAQQAWQGVNVNRRPVRQFWNPKVAPVASLGRHKTESTLDLIVDLTSQRLSQPPSALQALQNRCPRPASNQKTSARVYRPRGAPRETHSRALDSNTEHRPSSHLTFSLNRRPDSLKQASKQAGRSIDPQVGCRLSIPLQLAVLASLPFPPLSPLFESKA
ncbi:hypothetical protein CPAR01_00204 [Colletotrichum paranaense]|uniref:Uncharacterized protein n=1 Tax=Colletotrichum paranaense TaxID=1914294 RepID=A0ABQ9T378_9PEZI|nr:uncharacterized protein CPAR01_00204 [Colletotrichum paranaense]KAK1546237.1 hypothetical protein CPAR01_00204 [Colletotrichum paranaense]